MAYTKTETLITVVFTLHDGTTVTAADTADSRVGTGAFRAFEGGRTVVIEGTENTTYIPFHAVIKAVVTKTASTSQFTDDFCQEG